MTRALGLLLAAMPLACGGGEKGAPKPRPPPAVVVAKVSVRDVPVEVRAPVELRPFAQAEVGSKTLGYLDAVFVDRGDRVKRGQLIALVRPSDLPDQLGAARGSLAQAQASAALAKQNADRAAQLAPTGVVSQQELQQTQSALASADAQEAAAKAQVAGIATRLGETKITSPLDGVVTARRVDPGSLVGPTAGAAGGSIVTVARVDVLRMFVTVTERQAHLVRTGQNARVELDALEGRAASGNVVRLSPALDPATRTLDAEVQLDNKDGALRPGMFGRASIVVAIHPQAVVVPASAIQVSAGKRWAFALVGSKVARREVTVGVDGGDWLEIVKGLVADDEVVTVGSDIISDGTEVKATRGGGPSPASPSPAR